MDALWLTFCYSWMLALAYFLYDGASSSDNNLIFGVAFMWIPGLIALYCARKNGKPIPFKTTLNREVVKAALWPIGIVALTVLICLPFGDFVGFGHYRSQLPFFQTISEPFYSLLMSGLLIVTAVTAGCTINLLAALGEELLWRGYLFDYWKDVTPRRRDLYIGFFWGLWHAPAILMGHNYPGWPLEGVFVMILFTIALSPMLGYLRERSGSVLVPAIFHGTLNAAGPLVFFLFQNPQVLIVNVAGLAGIVAIVIWQVALTPLRAQLRYVNSHG